MANVGINSVNDKFKNMDRVNEIIGHLTDEEYDAVLYGVMLRFLKKRAKNYDVNPFDLLLNVDEESKTIDVYDEDGNYLKSWSAFYEA